MINIHVICIQFNGCSFARLQPGVIGGEKSNMGLLENQVHCMLKGAIILNRNENCGICSTVVCIMNKVYLFVCMTDYVNE